MKYGSRDKDGCEVKWTCYTSKDIMEKVPTDIPCLCGHTMSAHRYNSEECYGCVICFWYDPIAVEEKE